MRLLKAIYEKTHNRPAPYYYNYSLKTVFFKPIRKWLTNTVAAHCPFNCIRIAIYRICGFKIGKDTFIGMRCYLDDMCYDLLRIGDNVTISYGVYFACHGKGQEHLPITVDDGAYIGMRASIISKNVKNLREGVHIYSHATVGACTLVNQDVPENTTAVGIPCRIINPTDSSSVRCQQDEKMEVLQSYNDTNSGSA